MHRGRRPSTTIAALVALLTLVAACRTGPGPGGPGGDAGGNPGEGHGPPVRLNEIQVLASHNSYHVEPEPTLLQALKAVIGQEAEGFEYTHRPLADEFDAGVRQIELDVFVDDPDGGRYAQPVLVPALGLAPVDPALSTPGLKVLHVQEVDYRSTCPTFVDCLTQVRAWSDAHPDHLPITIQIEAKDGTIPDPGLGFVTPLPWTAADFGTLEAEIGSVFAPDRVLSPDEVRGRFATLTEAVQAGRLPEIDDVRGQVMFVLDDKGAKRDAYRTQVPDLAERSLFVDVPETDPDAAVMVVNDPIGSAHRTRALVQARLLLRTRADRDTVQARSGDTPATAPRRCDRADLSA